MLKTIHVRQLRVGMYLEELCASWLDTPLWRKSVLLNDVELIQQIVGSGITHAVIDTSKGLDIAQPVEQHRLEPEPKALLPTKSMPVHVGIAEERARAAKICAAAKAAVTAMFQEARLGRAVDVTEALPLVDEISQSVARNSDSLIALARLKTANDYTYLHSVAVCALMIALARQLQFDEQQVRHAGMAGLLHDIGKMAVPPEILDKPSSLTDEEFSRIKTHPVAGHRILSEAGGIVPMALDVCLRHHEKMDGSGYPGGLSGGAISLYARMGAVCDVYDALTSNRSYKPGWCPAHALRKMASWKGHFDEQVFQSFVKTVGIYPVGTLVRLTSGRLAVVLEQSEKSLLTPRVKVFFSTKSMTYITPETVDLAKPAARDKIASIEELHKWGITDLTAFWNEA